MIKRQLFNNKLISHNVVFINNIVKNFFFNFVDSFLTPLSSSEIVRLNVGGHLYTTTKSTLDRHHSMPLMSILQNCDKEGNVFVDRNGRMFEYILEFLRTDKLCLPDDFSDFDSLTTEVIFFDIPNLSSCLEKAKQKKLFAKYIEILETYLEVYGISKTVLRGRKEDLKTFPLEILEAGEFKPNNAEDSSYVEITLHARNARLLLTEFLSINNWTCESSDFSPLYDPNQSASRILTCCYRDRWKK